MYILYDANGQDIIYAADTSKEMADYMHTTAKSVLRRASSYRAKRDRDPNYSPRHPFVVRETHGGYSIDYEELISLAQEGLNAKQIATRLGAHPQSIRKLLDEFADEIGEVKGQYVNKARNVAGLRQEWGREWEDVTSRLRRSPYDLSQIRLVKE